MSDTDNLPQSAGEPRRFGDYLIHGLLGEGGMARIYAGEELLSRRPVALKVLRAEFADSEQGRRQFLTEMNILANIDDPHIVRCLSCVEIERQPVMVLEQLDGWTLRQMLDARVALPWPEVAGIALQIARALHAAHSRRPPVVHRDLKPENVMCLRDGRVKVMDFGIAKVLQGLSGGLSGPTSQAMGTMQYMSPEQVDAKPVDGRTDLFALGLVMWEMLAGWPPFVSDSPRVLLEQICVQPTPPLPDRARAGLPIQLEALLGRLLAKPPEQRPSSASEVIIALEVLVGGPGLAERGRAQAFAATVPARPPAAPPHDTLDLVESARKSPLQRQVEQQFDEVAQAVSRFGRATSAAIVRVLVGTMIFPAAAVISILVPAGLVGLNLLLLTEDQHAVMFESDFDKWGSPELLPVLLVSLIVFVRACWVHHRPPGSGAILKPWLVLGALIAVAWGGATALEFGTDTHFDERVHFATIAAFASWLAITLSWALGRVTSVILRRLERAPTDA